MNQSLNARAPLGCAALAACALWLGACASLNPFDRDSGTARAPNAAPTAATSPSAMADTLEAAADQPTATEAAAMGADQPSTDSMESAGNVAASPIRSDAPSTYTVKRGDTLWDISSTFLRDPWRWPDIWRANPQVRNPHLIYPGDVLALVEGADGSRQLRLTRGAAGGQADAQFGSGARLDPQLRSSPLDGAIATIPYAAIAAFLERPAVLAEEQIRNSPRVLAVRGEHMIAGAGHDIYVRGLTGEAATRYMVMHVDEPIRDPESGDLLGYSSVYTGTASVITPGDPGKARLTESARETLEGDRLLSSDTDVPLNFTPRAPTSNVRGQIVSVIDGVELIGQYRIVAINRGLNHGVEPGHVLAIDSAGETTRDRTVKSLGRIGFATAFAPEVRLPDERAGTLLVFKSYDRMSYGLVVGAADAIRVEDVVRTP